jgi:uncharacterized membrane protein (DUF485 family)
VAKSDPIESSDTPVPVEPNRELIGKLMRDQAALGARVAVIFLVLVFGLPILTHFAPELTRTPVLGFPFAWFLLGLLFYPITWALSAYFVKESEKLEAAQADLVRGKQAGS